MIAIEELFYEKIKSIMSQWNEDGIYAISFFVESNESNEYEEFSGVTDFSISYNTEHNCKNAGEYSEKRWNYAFWRQDETPIVDTGNNNPEAKLLFQWYKENNITDIGYEDSDCYDDKNNYIGRGPVGHYELLCIASNVAKRLQKEEFLLKKFQKKIPIVVHGLEYAWYDIEATKNANSNHEADTFLKAMDKPGLL